MHDLAVAVEKPYRSYPGAPPPLGFGDPVKTPKLTRLAWWKRVPRTASSRGSTCGKQPRRKRPAKEGRNKKQPCRKWGVWSCTARGSAKGNRESKSNVNNACGKLKRRTASARTCEARNFPTGPNVGFLTPSPRCQDWPRSQLSQPLRSRRLLPRRRHGQLLAGEALQPAEEETGHGP